MYLTPSLDHLLEIEIHLTEYKYKYNSELDKVQLTPSSTHLLPSLNPSPYEHWLPSSVYPSIEGVYPSISISVYPSIVAVYILQDSVPSANFRPSYFSVISITKGSD